MSDLAETLLPKSQIFKLYIKKEMFKNKQTNKNNESDMHHSY